MDYKSLSKWGYINHNESVIDEYEKRYNSPTTIKTGLFINPILRGERQPEVRELFIMPIQEMLSLQDTIMQNSKKITELRNDLPGIASGQLFNHTLTNEVMSTNDIEDVKTTSEEITEAIASVKNNSSRKTRLNSFVRMYFKINNRENLNIKKLEDIREIYDFLLEGEVAEEDLPDGKIFRNSYARIGNDVKTNHVPKLKEEDTSRDLVEWIKFINGNTPFLIKALVSHYFFEYIHPFKDGNGRTGRYIACVYLGYKLDPLTAITLSSEINKNRSKYYKSFVDVENPKNYGEVTFFVIDMMKLLIKGQKALLEDLEEKKNMLFYGEKLLNTFAKTNEEKTLLYLHFQSYLFNDVSDGIEDRDLKQYTTKFKKIQVKRTLENLTEKGALEITKKSPKTRRLSTEWFDKLLEN